MRTSAIILYASESFEVRAEIAHGLGIAVGGQDREVYQCVGIGILMIPPPKFKRGWKKTSLYIPNTRTRALVRSRYPRGDERVAICDI